MIEIRGSFTDWNEVSKEKAKDYAKFLYRMTLCLNKDEKITYIKKHIRGISVSELLEED